MKVRYDDRTVVLTERFKAALREVMASESEMMGDQCRYSDFWIWGRATVLDLSKKDGIEFEFGGDEDMPNDGLGAFAIIAGELNKPGAMR